MTIVIPHQLKNKDFRFIKIAMSGMSERKRPLETNWQTMNNYQYFDYELTNWLRNENNYGIVCGYGNLAVIDADDAAIADLVRTKLPPTFTIRTGSGGMHFYYTVPDLEKKIVLKDNDKKHYGEIQWQGSQVIGPGSIHPSNNKYTIVDNSEITTITKEQIDAALSNYIQKESPMTNYQRNTSSNYEFIDVSKCLSLGGLTRIGDECKGKHPVHGSSTGGNFSVNIRKGVFHCFRCGTGGGPIALIAMLNGLINCSDVKPGCITPEIYLQVIKIAKEKYGIIIEE